MCAFDSLTKVVSGIAMALWMPFFMVAHAQGIERLAPAQSFSVDLVSTSKGVRLPPAPGMFDDLLYSHTFESLPVGTKRGSLNTSLLGAGQSLRPFSVNHKQMASLRLTASPELESGGGALSEWALGSNAWRYQGLANTDLLIGNASMGSPEWMNSPKVGGIQLSQRFSDNGERFPWRYNLSVGALDHGGSVAEGDLKYGPTAGGLWVDVDLSQQMQVEALVEAAPSMQLSGVGARYETQDWGAWASSVARASHAYGSGWRYQMRYDTDVLPSLNVALLSERYQGDFVDLSRYGQSSLGTGAKRAIDANVGLGRWGTLQGRFSSQRSQFGAPTQQLGLSQQFWYSPNLRVGLQAQRELHNGDYNMILRLAVPLP